MSAKARSLQAFQANLSNKLAAAAARELSDLALPVQVQDDRWLFRTGTVRKVLTSVKPVKVPGAPVHVLGLLSQGNTLYTLVDFNLLLGLPAVRPSAKTRVLCLETGQHDSNIALLVERVLDMQPLGALGQGLTADHPLSDALYVSSEHRQRLAATARIALAAELEDVRGAHGQ